MIFEMCPDCEKEVSIKQTFSRQKCPGCKRFILPCSLCNPNESNCVECYAEQKESKRGLRE